jgi:hypothetical protein
MEQEQSSGSLDWIVIVLIIVILAIGAFIGIRYWNSQKTTTPSAPVLNIESRPVETQVQPLSQPADVKADNPDPISINESKKYTNPDYNFSLNFSDDWKGYKVSKDETGIEGITALYRIYVPDGKDFVDVAVISVFSKTQWDAIMKEEMVFQTKLGTVSKNGVEYTVAYQVGNGLTGDFIKFMKLAQELMKTFKAE